MKSLPVAVLAAAVVALAGLAGWMGGQLGRPEPAAAPASDAGLADVRAHLEEIERSLANLERRLTQVEGIAAQARDTADAAARSGVAAPAPGSAAGAAAGTPRGPNAVGTDPGPGAAPVERTEEELREERIRRMQQAARTEQRRVVPAIFAQISSTKPGAAEARRHDALLEGRRIAIAMGESGDVADRLTEVLGAQIERMARDVGPLVREGLDRADLDQVERELDAAWQEADAKVRGFLDETKFAAYQDQVASTRRAIREVLAERRAQR